jgi:O-methyltransferase involved in polyketide biosynthesis
VSNIGISVVDSSWADCIKVRGKMLFIIEGLSMYLTAEENAKMLEIIRSNFDNAYILLECLAKKWVNKEHTEQSIKKTGAVFKFGADCFEDLGKAAEGFRKIKDDNIIRGMTCIYPICKPFSGLPLLKKVTQKILIFEKS